MIKKASLSILTALLLLVLLSPGLAQARSGLSIVSSSAEANFPALLTFSASVESDVDITDVRLHYTVDHDSYAQVTSEVYIELLPSSNVSVQWSWDMRKTGGLPPGSTLEYWWTAADAGGNKTSTNPVRLGFDDNRYSWQRLVEGSITIYWYEGNSSFAQEIMLAANQALAQLAEDTGAYLKKPVKIYIYANTQDLQGAMIFPQEWTGGVTFSRYGIIAIGIAPNNLTWGKRATAHELTHVVVHQMTFNPYIGLPVWLNEGLAMYNEGAPDVGISSSLGNAIAQDSLISVRSLSSPFSAYSEETSLSYAQSYSIVEFLISNYGQGKMLELLDTFRAGSSYDGALDNVYGFDMDGLNTLWRDYATRQYQKPAAITLMVSPTQPGAEPVLQTVVSAILAGLATALLLVLGLAAESWTWRRGW